MLKSALATPILVLGFALAVMAQSFTVIGLPDTQRYSEQFPAVYAQQTQWVANNIDLLDIRYVSHYGDIVQNADQISEWNNADFAMDILDATGIPQGVTAGNHDITPTGTFGEPYIPQFYQQYFGPQRYSGETWFRGASPSGMSSYQVFNAGAVQFLTLHVECDAALRELEWAQGILDANRDKPVLFTTHRYLQDSEDYLPGSLPVNISGRYPGIWYLIETPYTPDGIQSEELWDWFIRRNPNIFMVQCGHFHEEYRQVSTNVYGQPVLEILADYQDDPNGGDGWLRIMNFNMDQNLIDFDTYSPFLNQTRTADESDFTLPVVFDNYFDRRPTLVLREGVNSYLGTQDTWINEGDPDASYGQNGVRIVDDDTLNIPLFSDDLGQGLIRFDGLFDGSNGGLMPDGAQIVSAHLTLQLADDVNLFNADFDVHRCLVPWTESSTWNSLGNGLSGSELSGLVATFAGDNDPDGDGIRRIDVTTAVQAWANGAANHGFAIVPEIVFGNDDGIEIHTSESTNPLFRPVLEIVWDSVAAFIPYGFNNAPANDMELQGYGIPKIGETVELVCEGSPASVALFAVSGAPTVIPALDGEILVDPSQFAIDFQSLPSINGQSSWFVEIPNIPALDGFSFYVQAFAFDASQLADIVFSNGLEVRVGN